MPRLWLAAVLLVFVAGCDSADLEVEPALFDLTATTTDGRPAAGLDVFATYGALLSDAARSASSRASAADLRAPFPSPARDFTTVTFGLDAAGTVRLSILDVSGEVMDIVVDGDFAAGQHQVFVPLDAYPAGVYPVVLEVGGERVVRYALKTDAAVEGIVAGLAIRLGQTDAQGRLVVQDSIRFPALFDVPRQFEVINEIGSVSRLLRGRPHVWPRAPGCPRPDLVLEGDARRGRDCPRGHVRAVASRYWPFLDSSGDVIPVASSRSAAGLRCHVARFLIR